MGLLGLAKIALIVLGLAFVVYLFAPYLPGGEWCGLNAPGDWHGACAYALGVLGGVRDLSSAIIGPLIGLLPGRV